MKKFLTILVALLFSSAILHLTVALHYCGGKISDTKISVTGKMASCGMQHEMDLSLVTSVSSRCCDDETLIYSVDNDYAPSALKTIKAFQNGSVQFFTGLNSLNNPIFSTSLNYSDTGPPVFSSPSSVSLTRICTYRI